MSTKFIVFSNPGEADLRALTLLGVNVKGNEDGAIGHFGTGFKFGLATAFRHGCSVSVLCGAARTDFFVENESIRGKVFGVVHARYRDDSDHGGFVLPLGFTTELGKQWQPWMAYREFWANAMDEQGSVCELDAMPVAEAGWTKVVVSGEALAAVHAARDDYFIPPGDPLWSGHGVEVFPASPTAIAYQRIRMVASNTSEDVAEPKCAKALFTYNLTRHQNLTEDRTLASVYEARSQIAKALMQCKDEEICRAIVTAPDGTLEAMLNFDWYSCEPSREFKGLAFASLRGKTLRNMTLRGMLKRVDPDGWRTAKAKAVPASWGEMQAQAPEAARMPESDYDRYKRELEDQLAKALAAAEYWKACASTLAGTPMTVSSDDASDTDPF